MNSKDRLVSVIMPSYNSAETIKDSIESIIDQTYKNWELIIIDDCSSDETFDIVENSFNDKRILVKRLSQNSGTGIARNEGIKLAKGRFIAFCDSDDRWLPEKLSRQISFMIKEDLSFTYTSYFICDISGKKTHEVQVVPELSFATMLKNNYMGCLTVVYDSEKLGKYFFPEYRKRQDWALWLILLKSVPLAKGIPEPLALYRIGNKSLSSNKIKLVNETYKFYNNNLGMGRLQSMWWLGKFMYYYIEKNKLIKEL